MLPSEVGGSTIGVFENWFCRKSRTQAQVLNKYVSALHWDLCLFHQAHWRRNFFFRKVIVKIWLLNIPILLYSLVWWSCFDSSNLHKIIGIIYHGQNLYFLQNVENGKMELNILPVVTWAALTSCSTPPSSLEQRHRRGLHRPWRQQLVSWWKKPLLSYPSAVT